MGLGLASKAFYAMKDCCRKTVGIYKTPHNSENHSLIKLSQCVPFSLGLGSFLFFSGIVH